MTNKPQFLYHASQNREIEVFEPRAVSIRNPEEGPVVFATPGKDQAVKFLVQSNDSWVKLSEFWYGDNQRLNVAIISDEERFRASDQGGTVYRLPSSSFTLETKFGGGKNEWTSKTAVRPIDKQEYESGLLAMLENGVGVYFVDKTTFDEIGQSDDHGFEIIRNLTPYSEPAKK